MLFELWNVENGPVGWLPHAAKVWPKERRHLDLKITFGWICTRLTNAKLLKLLALSCNMLAHILALRDRLQTLHTASRCSNCVFCPKRDERGSFIWEDSLCQWDFQLHFLSVQNDSATTIDHNAYSELGNFIRASRTAVSNIFWQLGWNHHKAHLQFPKCPWFDDNVHAARSQTFRAMFSCNFENICTFTLCLHTC